MRFHSLRLRFFVCLPDRQRHLGVNQLKELYPKWEAFHQVRMELDPDGILLSPHMARLFH